jgi:hypothetical protein
MKLLPNWREVFWKAWSVRLIILAAILSAFEVVLPIVQMVVMIPQGWFALASLAITFAAVYARLVAQRPMGGCE